jgi:hypothetical protein
MSSGFELECYNESSCVDNSSICGAYRDAAEFGCELFLFLRFLMCVAQDMEVFPG